MTLLLWLAVGLVAGVLAKRVIPSMDKSNLIFVAIIAVIGAVFGGFAGELSGASSNHITEIIVAMVGTGLVLFFFRQYVTDINAGAID